MVTSLLLNESERAWLAGFIDGEGYIGITLQQKKETEAHAASPLYHPFLIIANTNYAILRHIQMCVGGGRLYVLKRGTTRMKESYQYKLTRMTTLLGVLYAVEPHLKVKTSQCTLLIEFVRRRMAAKRTVGRGSRGITSFTEHDQHTYEQLLGLNRRGPMQYAPLPR
ncbi:LAGLIDADG family homing endonuclease [Candidatus Parcubacteria bacterium]|nr:LAGLIDADG family homing endonuclease [Candidatus Parcubacteria bacterium]